MISSYNQSNRVHALLITKQKRPTLKFIIPCLQYSTRIQCAVFNSCMSNKNLCFQNSLSFWLAVIKSDQLPSYLKQISPMSDTILLFKEDYNHPDIVIKDVSQERRNSVWLKIYFRMI